MELNVSEVMDKAWALSKKHGLIVALFLFVAAIVSSAFAAMGFSWGEYMEVIASGDPDEIEAWANQNQFNAMSMVGSLITLLIGFGIMNMVLMLTRGTMHTPDVSAFKMPVTVYLNMFLMYIGLMVVLTIGFVLCLLPGFYLLLRLIFVPYCLLDRPEEGIGGAFSRSWNMTKGQELKLFLLGLISCGLIILGAMCCYFPVYFASAMSYFMLAVTYCHLTKGDDEPEVTENAGTSVYMK